MTISDGTRLARRVVLVGCPGSGKSTVGRLLADRVGYRFVDLDAEAERLAGLPLREIFRRGGEAAFRDLEAQATAAVEGLEPAVVAVGGGWMTRPELRDRWPDAVRVWLVAEPATVVRRLGADVRSRPLVDPARPEDCIRELLAVRQADYALADFAVRTDGLGPNAVAEKIEHLLIVRNRPADPAA